MSYLRVIFWNNVSGYLCKLGRCPMKSDLIGNCLYNRCSFVYGALWVFLFLFFSFAHWLYNKTSYFMSFSFSVKWWHWIKCSQVLYSLNVLISELWNKKCFVRSLAETIIWTAFNVRFWRIRTSIGLNSWWNRGWSILTYLITWKYLNIKMFKKQI